MENRLIYLKLTPEEREQRKRMLAQRQLDFAGNRGMVTPEKLADASTLVQGGGYTAPQALQGTTISATSVNSYNDWKAGGGMYAGGYDQWVKDQESKNKPEPTRTADGRPIIDGSIPSFDSLINGEAQITGPLDSQGKTRTRTESEEKKFLAQGGTADASSPVTPIKTSRQLKREEEMKLYGKYITPETIEEEQRLEEEKLKSDETLMEKQIREAKEAAEKQAEIAKGQALVSATGGTGVSLNQPVLTEGVKTAEQGLSSTMTTINQRKEELNTIRDQARQATAAGNVERALELRKMEKESITDLAQLEAAEAATQSAKYKEGQDRLTGLFDLGVVGGMTADQLAPALEAAGYDPLYAPAVIQAAKDAQDATNAEAQLKLQQTLQGMKSETDKAMEGYQKLQGALNDGTIDQEAFDALAVKLGFQEKPLSELDKQLKQADLDYKNAQTDQQRIDALKKKYDLQQMQGVFGDNPSIIDKLANVAVGQTMTRPEGKDKQYEGECAAFVNDIAGTSLGSTYGSKASFINNFNVLDPHVGDIFISNIGDYGHTGFIKSVNGDGTVTLMDQNRHGNKLVSERIVNISDLESKEGITGYYNLAKDAMNNAGGEQYKKELLPMYAKYNNGKMTSADWDTVEGLGIKTDMFTKQALASKTETDKAGAVFAEEIISLANTLKESKGRGFASVYGGVIPRTAAKDFDATFEAFVAKLGLDNLTELKSNGATFGALSNQELNFITNAATSLKKGMTEDAWDTELDRIIEKMSGALSSDYAVKQDAAAIYGGGSSGGELTGNDIPVF